MSIARLQALLDGIAARLSCQVVLDDERQRLLAHTDHDVTADDVRVASILARGATPEVRIWFEQWGILEATRPVRTPADSARGIDPRWVVPLRHDGMLLGFVSVLDRGGLTREQLEPVLASTAEIAETLYLSRLAEPRISALLQLLVLPPCPGDRGADVGLDLATVYPHPGPIAVVAFAARLPKADLDGLPELLAAVRHACLAFPAATALHAEIARTVVALVPLRSHAAIGPATRLAETVIGAAPAIPEVVAGISSATWTATSAANAYGESSRALRIALADPAAAAISLWDRAGALRALTLLPVGGDHDPIDPRVRALVAHPQLARTVETFLDNAGDAGATARQLQIHRTTLYQRLARVSDLCALDIQRSRGRPPGRPRRIAPRDARGRTAMVRRVRRRRHLLAARVPAVGQVAALRRDVVGQVLGVVPDAPDEARPAPRQPGQPEEVDAGLGRHAAPVPRPAALVEGVDLQPAVVDGEAGRPDDRGDPGARRGRARAAGSVTQSGSGPEHVRLRLLGQVEAVARDVGVGLVEQRQVVGVAAARCCRRRSGANRRVPSSNDGGPADERRCRGRRGRGSRRCGRRARR